MSPIDDELRALLRDRAGAVSPAPDPLGGIETRARSLRRRRALAAVGSAATVVAAVAVAVPLAMGGGSGTTVRQPIGSAKPTPAASTGALDPAHPWAFRGQSLTPEQRDGCGCSPLYAMQQGPWTEIFGVSTDPARPGLVHWHMSTTLKVLTTPAVSAMPADLRVLSWAIAGDDTNPAFLVVIAAPGSTVEFAQDASPDWQQISDVGRAPSGVGVVPIEGRTPGNRLRVTEPDGTLVEQLAPVYTPAHTSTPANVLGWVHRGSAQQLSDATVVAKFDAAMPGTGGHYRSLVDGTSNGLDFTFGQAWHDGDAAAHTVAYDSSGVLFLGPETPRDPWVMAAVFSRANAADLLLVLPRPGAGRVGYSPTATGPFTDVASGRSDLNSVGLVDRDPKALDDRVQVHRGDDSVILTEAVGKLTCGAKECG